MNNNATTTTTDTEHYGYLPITGDSLNYLRAQLSQTYYREVYSGTADNAVQALLRLQQIQNIEEDRGITPDEVERIVMFTESL